MTVQEVLEAFSGEGLHDWKSLVFVANSLDPVAENIRGIVTSDVFEPPNFQESYFSLMSEFTKRYENIPSYMINEQKSPAQALREHVADWPKDVVIVSSNVDKWTYPIVEDLQRRWDVFHGIHVKVIDISWLAEARYKYPVDRGDIERDLPHVDKKGGLHAVCRDLGVDRGNHARYSVVRATMLREAALKALKSELIKKDR